MRGTAPMSVAMHMAVNEFRDQLQAKLHDFYKVQTYPEFEPVVVLTEGPKYIRITKSTPRSNNVWGFVNKFNGDVFYPAGWKSPTTKHVRGNILADRIAALDQFGIYGMRTLR